MFHSNASFAYQEADIEEPSFYVSLDVEDTDSSSFDVVNEEEVTNGYSIVEDSLTHLVLSISSIMDYEIHIPNLSNPVHTSRVNDAQLSVFLDVCSSRSNIIYVLPLTILDLMFIYISCRNISSNAMRKYSKKKHRK